MRNYFEFSGEIENYLFFGFNIIDGLGIAGICIASLSLSILYEGLKMYRLYLFEVSGNLPYCLNSNSRLLENNGGCLTPADRSTINHKRIRLHFFQTTIHIINLFMGYLLMLTVMTFDGYYFISIILGQTIGYFCFKYFVQSLLLELYQQILENGVVEENESLNMVQSNGEEDIDSGSNSDSGRHQL